jgi:hypothetical protein
MWKAYVVSKGALVRAFKSRHSKSPKIVNEAKQMHIWHLEYFNSFRSHNSSLNGIFRGCQRLYEDIREQFDDM